MGKNKLQRFAENEALENVIQPNREELLAGFSMKGKWKQEFFKNDNPIVLELGCGKGEYSVALAQEYPDKNFIGVDIKGSRFWVGAKQAVSAEMKNIGFLRTQIQMIEYCFAENEVSEIWITFPDPQIRFKRANLRLTHPEFLKKYHTIIQKEGTMHLKTDSEFLHGYTQGILLAQEQKILLSQHDVYGSKADNLPKLVSEIQTHYEKLFAAEGKKITYLQFQLAF